MLIEFRIKNFRSFKEEQVFSMVAGKDKSLPDNCFESGGFKLLKSSALYGHNASGKSNLLKGLFAMKHIIKKSTDVKSGVLSELISSFKFDQEYQNEPTKFEVTFLHKSIRYQYGFTANQDKIIEEWLYAYPKNRQQKWFERKLDNEKNLTNWYLNKTYLKGGEESLNQLKDKTRDDSLFLSVGFQWNNLQLTEVFSWFTNKLRIIDSYSAINNVTVSFLSDGEDSTEENEIKKFVIEAMKIADLGIDDIVVEESNVKLPQRFLDDLKDDAREEFLESIKNKKSYKTTFLHKVEGSKTLLPLNSSEESQGTQNYFELIGPWLDAIANGYIVFFDELETSLHPLLVSSLIKIVNDKKVNSNGAQIIFTTHETTLLNSELLRRDQIWFTEKNNQGATKIYSLLEYKPRQGEALQKGYLSGRYGAIPIIEEFEINDI